MTRHSLTRYSSIRGSFTAGALLLGGALAAGGLRAAVASAPAAPAPASSAAAPASGKGPLSRYSGLSSPESVLYDAASDRYLVSNVNGNPTDHDNNGFISVLSPSGEITALKWIEGGKNGVKLDAPKGLALVKGTLYVADISVVRTFDARTGAPRGNIAVPGSTFLSDLVAGDDGKIYLTDAGPPQGEFDGSGTEAVYVIKGNHARPLAKGSELGRPDGLAWSDKGPVISPFGSDEIYRLDAHGKRQEVTKLPAGGLAGIVKLADDGYLVASWQTSSIYRGKLGGTFEVALAGQKSPADIGYDTKRARLLVPHFTEGTVEAFALE
jgi:hypothetical protein